VSVQRCPRCGFVGVFRVMAMQTGTMHDADSKKRNVCPNDGVDLVNVPQEELDAWTREAVAKCGEETQHRVLDIAGRCGCGAVRWSECVACDGLGHVHVIVEELLVGCEPCWWCDGRGFLRP
jgi:hypothetical protein